MVDSNVVLVAPQPDGSALYYQNYVQGYSTDYLNWVIDFPQLNGFYTAVSPPQPVAAEPVAPAASDPTYASDYQTYLTEYNRGCKATSPATTSSSSGDAPGPLAALQPNSYLNYASEYLNYANYVFNNVFDPNTGASSYFFAPLAPTFVASSGSGGGGSPVLPPPLAANANAPSNMGTAADPLPVQFAALMAGQSASYRLVAGALTQSANPLAVANAVNFAPGGALAGQGNVEIDGHIALNGLNGTNAEIVAPTTVRTGTGWINIAAGGDFRTARPDGARCRLYQAGTPVQPAIGGDATTIALGLGAINDGNGNALGTGLSTILTPEVNPANAGNITLTAQGDIDGIENVRDTLASGNPGGAFNASPSSGLSSNPGAFLGQFWSPWLLTNSANPSVPWYVNFGSFDQGVMSIGGDVTVRLAATSTISPCRCRPPLISTARTSSTLPVVATSPSPPAAASTAAISTSAKVREASRRAAPSLRTSPMAVHRPFRCRLCSRSNTHD